MRYAIFKKSLLWTIAAVLTFVFTRQATLLYQTKVHAQSTAPFTLSTLTLFPKEGQLVVHKRDTIRVRADGVQNVTSSAPKSSLAEILSKTTFPDGRCVRSISTIRGSSTSYDRRPSAASFGPVPKADCTRRPTDHVLRSEVLLGRSVKVIESRVTLSNGSNRMLYFLHWRDPELGCVALRAERYEVNKDGRMVLLSQEEPVNLSLGDPSPSSFSVPSDYAEMPPSELHRRWMESVGVTPAPGDVAALSRADRRYFSHNRHSN